MRLDSPTAQPPTIVVVDDDSALCGALAFAFELDGFQVRTDRSAEALLAAPPLPVESCCLVLDYRLPGADGLTLLNTLHKRHPDLPALLMTSNPPAELRRRAAAAGVGIVEKPLIGDNLINAVNALLETAA